MSAATSLRPPDRVIPADALTEEVNGEITEKDMSAGATWLAGRLHTRLDTFVETNRLGTVVSEALFVLDPAGTLKRRPDVAFISTQRWPLENDPPFDGDWRLAPDLAVEVISPNDVVEDINDKLIEYFSHGIRQAWVVLPKQRLVYIYDSMDRVKLLPQDGAIESSLIPGFKLPLVTLFRVKPTDQSRP